jgi:hypothetical protein
MNTTQPNVSIIAVFDSSKTAYTSQFCLIDWIRDCPAEFILLTGETSSRGEAVKAKAIAPTTYTQ